MKRFGILLLLAISMARCGNEETTELCVKRHGDYVSVDRAISERNDLRSQGYNAWFEYHGSLYAGTRTYVVFMMGSCY